MKIKADYNVCEFAFSLPQCGGIEWRWCYSGPCWGTMVKLAYPWHFDSQSHCIKKSLNVHVKGQTHYKSVCILITLRISPKYVHVPLVQYLAQ